MSSARRCVTTLTGGISLAVLVIARGPSVSNRPQAVEVELGPGDSSATSASPKREAATPTPQALCANALSDFGAKAAAAGWGDAFDADLLSERERCREALTTSAHRADCNAIGELDDYEACVLGCIRSVRIPAPYVPGDAVDNCESPCAQSYQCE
jgi:hypothetical protein